MIVDVIKHNNKHNAHNKIHSADKCAEYNHNNKHNKHNKNRSAYVCAYYEHNNKLNKLKTTILRLIVPNIGILIRKIKPNKNHSADACAYYTHYNKHNLNKQYLSAYDCA